MQRGYGNTKEERCASFELRRCLPQHELQSKKLFALRSAKSIKQRHVLLEEARGFAAHESSAYRDHIGLAVRQINDLLNNLNAANMKTVELEQQLHT